MTPIRNKATIIRKELMIRLCRILMDKNLEMANRISLEMNPKSKDPRRCCIYKDRAILKYKIMSLLGYAETDEKDELTPLSHYVSHARGHENFFLNLITEACSNCPPAHYEVSNLCRACEARPCQVNCPKDAVCFKNGKARINKEACVNCGKCMKECPYNAITYQPRPCEESCPVKAILQDGNGNEYIDMSKCILCGKCMQACPFGAIMPSTELPEIIDDISQHKKVIALVAPSIDGQFREPLSQIYGSIIALGFSELAEVAWGAELTAQHESRELHEILEGKSKTPLLSSCCASWVSYTNKHAPDLSKNISTTPSPLFFTAEEIRRTSPDATLVFIGPCLSKKKEAKGSTACDYSLSFEELGSWIVAAHIEIGEQSDHQPILQGKVLGKGFAQAGGVCAAIKDGLNHEARIDFIHGLGKANQRIIQQNITKNAYDFLEVMSCEEGCIGGCQNIVSANEGKRIFTKKLLSL